MILDDTTIRRLCEKAERVIITGDEQSKSIGLKVGEFSQATPINSQMSAEEQEVAVRKLMMDLRMMNKRFEWQQKKAAKERNS